MAASATSLLPVIFHGNVQVFAQIVPERKVAGYF